MTKKKNPEDIISKGGRPTTYTTELADKICEIVASTEMGIDEICRTFDWAPSSTTIYHWRIHHPEYSKKYYLAKERQGELFAENTISIAREKVYIEDNNGSSKIDPGYVAWQKMNVGVRQWHASKLAPKTYGDKSVIENKVTVSHEDALKTLI